MAEGTVIKKLVHQLTLDDNQFSIGMKDAEGKFASFTGVIKVGTAAIGAAVGTMTAVGAAAAEITRETVKVGDKFDKMSQSIGISVERLSAYDHVANLSGTSLAGLATGVGRLSRNIRDFAEGKGEAKDAFETLGISATDSSGKLRDADEVMIDIASKFEKMPDGAEKTALSMELLGRSGKDLIPMFNAGAEGMAEMLKEGTALRGWTTAEAKEAALLNDNFTRTTTQIKGVKDTIGKELIPVFNVIVEATRQWFIDNKDLIDNTLAKFPEVIRGFVIPAFSALLETGNLVVAGIKIGWQGLQIAVKAYVKLIMGEINLLVQGFAKIAGGIPGVGKVIKGLAETTQSAYDSINESIDKNVANIYDATEKHRENKEKIERLQDSLTMKYEESHSRMTQETKEFNKFVIKDTVETNEELKEEREKREKEEKEAREKRQKEIQDTETELKDKLNELTEDKYDYQRIKLEEEYDLKSKNVTDRKLLDEWYDAEWRKIQTAEEKEFTQAEKRKKDVVIKEEEEKNRVRNKLIDDYADAIVKGGNIEESITKATADTVKNTLQESAKEKIKILLEAAIKIITGHVAEGLSMVGASSFTIYDAIAGIASYAASIGASIAGAKAIAGKVNLAGGGWLDKNPRGGVISEGTHPRADDVFLGSGGDASYWGSNSEFVVNANATKKWAPLLSFINATGYAGGGFLGDIAKAVSPIKPYTGNMSETEKIEATAWNLSLGMAKSALTGWATAGDWLQGIPFGAKDGATNLGVAIPSMFVGKMAGKGMAKNALGFGLGGFIKKAVKVVTNPIGATIDAVKDPKGYFGGGFDDLSQLWKDPSGALKDVANTLKDDWAELLFGIDHEAILQWILKNVKSLGMGSIAKQLMNPNIGKASLGDVTKKWGNILSIDNFLEGVNVLGGLPGFSNGGVITEQGLTPFGDDIPFAGRGRVGEVLLPAEKIGNTVNINIQLYGIDRENARSAVRDYIVPELNYYLSSKGAQTI